jgi:hypothetical protein
MSKLCVRQVACFSCGSIQSTFRQSLRSRYLIRYTDEDTAVGIEVDTTRICFHSFTSRIVRDWENIGAMKEASPPPPQKISASSSIHKIYVGLRKRKGVFQSVRAANLFNHKNVRNGNEWKRNLGRAKFNPNDCIDNEDVGVSWKPLPQRQVTVKHVQSLAYNRWRPPAAWLSSSAC